MRIEVATKGIDLTDNIRAHCQEKGGKLPKYFDRTILVTFRIEKHERRGYSVECIVDVEKHEDFVAKSESDDLFAAIDESTAKAQRQLADFKEKLKVEHHHRYPNHNQDAPH